MREGDGGGAQTAAMAHRAHDAVRPGRFSGLAGNKRDERDTEPAKRAASAGTHSDEVSTARDNHGRGSFLLLRKKGDVEVNAAVRNCNPSRQEPVIGSRLLGHNPVPPLDPLRFPLCTAQVRRNRVNARSLWVRAPAIKPSRIEQSILPETRAVAGQGRSLRPAAPRQYRAGSNAGRRPLRPAPGCRPPRSEASTAVAATSRSARAAAPTGASGSPAPSRSARRP